MTGLYIHVPFCKKKCHYCNYVSSAAASAESRTEFLRALEKEIQAALHRCGRIVFDTLYVGGGTPSCLDTCEMRELFGLLRSSFDFSKKAEITCEMNPDGCVDEKIKAYRELGINRISLGAQSFQEHILRSIGRTHTADSIRIAVQRLRHAGFENISLDLMLRLPGQTPECVEDSLKQAVALDAKQIVVYDLNVHEKTVFGVWQKQGKLALPCDEDHVRMWELCDEILVRNEAYRQYELLSFAKQGFESKHNMIYWKNESYLGLGPGAFSYMNGCRYQFAPSLSRYLKKCFASDWMPDTEDHLSAEDKEMETMLTGLRLDDGIDLDRFSLLRDHFERELAPLCEEKLVARDGDRVALTRFGRFFAEKVFVGLSSPRKSHDEITAYEKHDKGDT